MNKTYIPSPISVHAISNRTYLIWFLIWVFSHQSKHLERLSLKKLRILYSLRRAERLNIIVKSSIVTFRIKGVKIFYPKKYNLKCQNLKWSRLLKIKGNRSTWIVYQKYQTTMQGQAMLIISTKKMKQMSSVKVVQVFPSSK